LLFILQEHFDFQLCILLLIGDLISSLFKESFDWSSGLDSVLLDCCLERFYDGHTDYDYDSDIDSLEFCCSFSSSWH